MKPSPTPALPEAPPGLWPRLASMIYESVLLFGVVVTANLPVVIIAHYAGLDAHGLRPVLQWVSVAVMGAYFAYCWSRSGQTLAMKSWGLRVVDRDGGPLPFRRAVLRYVLAWSLLLPGLAAVALTQTHAAADAALFFSCFLLMLFLARLDPQRQLLHDRLLGSRVIRVPIR